MKKLLLAGAALTLLSSASAFAADLPPQAAPIPAKAPVYVAPIYNWTGFYFGGHVGGGWASQQSTELAPGVAAFPTGTVFSKNNMSGFLGGAQAGVNWQFSSLVVGVEGEYSWADVKGTATTTGIGGFTSTVTAKARDYALASGRIGYAADNWLFFAKGGGAWEQVKSSGVGTLANGTVFDTTTGGANRTGWVAGVGVEWGFAPNWSAKLEYNHLDFGTKTISVTSTAIGVSNVSNRDTAEVVKAGVNYHINWGGPVVARY